MISVRRLGQLCRRKERNNPLHYFTATAAPPSAPISLSPDNKHHPNVTLPSSRDPRPPERNPPADRRRKDTKKDLLRAAEQLQGSHGPIGSPMRFPRRGSERQGRYRRCETRRCRAAFNCISQAGQRGRDLTAGGGEVLAGRAEFVASGAARLLARCAVFVSATTRL